MRLWCGCWRDKLKVVETRKGTRRGSGGVARRVLVEKGMKRNMEGERRGRAVVTVWKGI